MAVRSPSVFTIYSADDEPLFALPQGDDPLTNLQLMQVRHMPRHLDNMPSHHGNMTHHHGNATAPYCGGRGATTCEALRELDYMRARAYFRGRGGVGERGLEARACSMIAHFLP